MIRILNAEPLGYSDEARAVLRSLGELSEEPLDRAGLLAKLLNYDVLLVRLAHQVDREVIDVSPRLKAIVSATTGLDHIDVDYAQSKGVAVLSLQGEGQFLRTVSATAEHTWALLLALLRQIPAAIASVHRGDWLRDHFRGRELKGSRLGLAGFGRIGQMVARYGRAFGMKVSAYDPYVPEFSDGAKRCSSLQELLQGSDVLSLHVPLNRETAGIIGADELALLPPQAVLVNTSRGELVDESALLRALADGDLAGAALDVRHGERDQRGWRSSPLLAYARAHENLIITPHIAGATHESMAKTEVFMAHRLARFLRRRRLERSFS